MTTRKTNLLDKKDLVIDQLNEKASAEEILGSAAIKSSSALTGLVKEFFTENKKPILKSKLKHIDSIELPIAKEKNAKKKQQTKK